MPFNGQAGMLSVSEHAEIRNAVAHADRPFQVIPGGRDREGGDGEGPPPSPGGDSNECPVTALGHLDGTFHFLDQVGQRRTLTPAQMSRRADLVALFRDEVWLTASFPKTVEKKDDKGNVTTEVVGYHIASATKYLVSACFAAGLFGDHIRIRPAGIWRDADGQPVIHAGDGVMVAGRWHPPGHRTGNNVWAAAPPAPRPAAGCVAELGRAVQQRMQELWNFKLGGGAIVVLGLIGSGYFGAAAPWRPNGFFLGPAGCGKSQLLEACRALIPMHHYTNETTKAGLEQALAGRAMPCLVDEAGVAVDARAAQDLINLVLAASGGDGTRGLRGGIDGRARTIELIGCIIMAATHPPEMQPQHLARFTLVDLLKPAEGADFSAEHRDFIADMRALAPRLWGRALGAFDRYITSREVFREALRGSGCAPREMDQIGAILAGWWILTADGVPTDHQARDGVAALDGFVRTGEVIAEEDAARRVVQHLLSCSVQMQRSTHRRQIGVLMDVCWRGYLDRDEVQNEDDDRSPKSAAEALANYGIRVIHRGDVNDKRTKRPVPRMAAGDGVWIAYRVGAMAELFRGTAYEGMRWLYELKRLEGARASGTTVRIGGYCGHALWLSRDDIYPGWRDELPQETEGIEENRIP